VTLDRKVEQIGRDLTELENPMNDIEIESTVHDDVLRLMFTACHPVLSSEARVARTLKMIGGLSTEEIARAFVVPVPTMAQRIVRAKNALSDAEVPFEIPAGDALAERFSSVLEVAYLVFNEGYTATSGSTWTRPALCAEAMRCCRGFADLRVLADLRLRFVSHLGDMEVRHWPRALRHDENSALIHPTSALVFGCEPTGGRR
jgi:predicted RNA polymerase sigma factor